MKGKVAIVFGVLATTVLLVVLMTVSPDQATTPAPETTAPSPTQPVPAPTHNEPPPATQRPAAPPPAPLPTEEDLAEIEDRIASSVSRLRFPNRVLNWWFSKPKMSDEDCEKARGLYLRFLDDFARMKTVEFHVEEFYVMGDGSQQLHTTRDFVCDTNKHRIETTRYDTGGKPEIVLAVCDGRMRRVWVDGREVERLKRGYASGYGGSGLYGLELMTVRDPHPIFLDEYTNVELDNGSTGYSRLWGPGGMETRFNTTTGLLTETRRSNGDSIRDTYQNVNGLWFPLERVRTLSEASIWNWGNVREIREVYSRVVLNEPVDEALFDVNKPN
ncbi:MAG TPA: hypothetical protein VMZ06_15765 [Candidatus Bathyarchaeia archaeon]|nr:hypothetical protein [Candidatus Bathyarchaeia archaeon]